MNRIIRKCIADVSVAHPRTLPAPHLCSADLTRLNASLSVLARPASASHLVVSRSHPLELVQEPASDAGDFSHPLNRPTSSERLVECTHPAVGRDPQPMLESLVREWCLGPFTHAFSL